MSTVADPSAQCQAVGCTVQYVSKGVGQSVVTGACACVGWADVGWSVSNGRNRVYRVTTKSEETKAWDAACLKPSRGWGR